MARPNVKITLGNGGLGRSSASSDGVAGLVVTGREAEGGHPGGGVQEFQGQGVCPRGGDGDAAAGRTGDNRGTGRGAL